jgi:hypothetical protein
VTLLEMNDLFDTIDEQGIIGPARGPKAACAGDRSFETGRKTGTARAGSALSGEFGLTLGGAFHEEAA